VTEDFWSPAKTALERVPADPPGTETLTRRARSLRTRRYAVAGLALLVVGVGILFPLGLLSGLGTQSEKGRIRPGAPIQTPVTEESEAATQTPVTEESGAPTQTPVTEESGSVLPELPVEPFPPAPAGSVTEIGSGTAFGGKWTLSAYEVEEGEYKGDICYSITGVFEASGCSDSTAGADSSVHVVGHTFHPDPDRPVVHGVAGKNVAGITLTLDDGRVLSTETLKSKSFPVAFFVIPFEGDTRVAAIEVLDADGKVLEESSFRP
jgi:hypothetical protein